MPKLGRRSVFIKRLCRENAFKLEIGDSYNLLALS